MKCAFLFYYFKFLVYSCKINTKKTIFNWRWLYFILKYSTYVTGDPKPPYNGKLRLYSMRYCPFAHRAALTLLAKQLDFEVINCKIFKPKPEWLNEINPFGKIFKFPYYGVSGTIIIWLR